MRFRLVSKTSLQAIFSIVIGITHPEAFGLAFDQDEPPGIITDAIFKPYIHTVLLKSADWEFSMPVISIGTHQQLEFRFDDLSGERRTFGYTLVHCSADWLKSPLSSGEYLSGYGQGTLHESFPSFNTSYSYTHYRLLFPNDDCAPLISGNYALIVYDENNPEEPVITRRFYVTENSVQIIAEIKQPGYGTQKETGQQVLFNVNYNSTDIRDPLHEITAIVVQNNRSDRQLVMHKPYSIQPGRLEYTDPEMGIFNAGNEFRSLDIKNTRYQTENVASIEFQNPYYHVLMKPDEGRANKPYFTKTDLNGSFFIDMEKSTDRHTEADYVFVHFNLKLPVLYTADKVFVSGALTQWTNNELNRMKFNEETGRFELTLLLKQGLYDYCFSKQDYDNIINEYDVEGSFYETENDYAVLIYFHDPYQRCDRLMGYHSIK